MTTYDSSILLPAVLAMIAIALPLVATLRQWLRGNPLTRYSFMRLTTVSLLVFAAWYVGKVYFHIQGWQEGVFIVVLGSLWLAFENLENAAFTVGRFCASFVIAAGFFLALWAIVHVFDIDLERNPYKKA